jgi:hypothetical protein
MKVSSTLQLPRPHTFAIPPLPLPITSALCNPEAFLITDCGSDFRNNVVTLHFFVPRQFDDFHLVSFSGDVEIFTE